MYKVFINNSVLLFQDSDQKKMNYSLTIINPSKDELLRTIQKLELESEVHKVLVICNDLNSTWKLFMENYSLIVAAGGVVKNNLDEILMIYRNDKWDLPKGKVEKNEAIPIAAIREVEEECGINSIDIVASLPPTFHTYSLNGKRILKRTDWFSMRTNYNKKLTPQIEEGITAVRWVKENELGQLSQKTYASIVDVFENLYPKGMVK